MKKLIYEGNFNGMPVSVIETPKNIYLKFGNKVSQTSMNKDFPVSRLMLGYTQNMIQGLSLCPFPHRILMIGLGGGSVVKYLYKYLKCEIDVIELIPDVVHTAHKYFYLPDTPDIQIITEDALTALDKLYEQNKIYDLIFVDTFGPTGIPKKLRTEEFYQKIKNVLLQNDRGWVIANTWANMRNYEQVLEPWKKVFNHVLLVDDKKKISWNMIVFAGNKLPKNDDFIIGEMQKLLPTTGYKQDIILNKKFKEV